MGRESKAAGRQFLVQLIDPVFQRSVLDGQLQIAHPHIEQLVVRQGVEILLSARHDFRQLLAVRAEKSITDAASVYSTNAPCLYPITGIQAKLIL